MKYKNQKLFRFGKDNPNWKGGKIKVNCRICKKEILAKPSELKRKHNKYCSVRCQNIGRSGENHPQWKGGTYKTLNGYIMKYAPNHPKAFQNRVYEHILVVEKHLGRYLNSKEIVHHINHYKSDNRITNLILFKSQYAHKKYEAIQEGMEAGEIIFDGSNGKKPEEFLIEA